MTKVYTVLMTMKHDENDTVLVEVPDMEILTEGYGLADAIHMARDAIGLAGIVIQDEGEEVPEPSKYEDVDESKSVHAGVGNAMKVFVDVDFSEYRRKHDHKSVRRNVTIPNWLNREAEEANLNVSKVLQDALKEKLGVA